MNSTDPLTANCPTCHKKVIWNSEAPYRPFCSKRCQLLDLGAWANEENTISTTLAEDDVLDIPAADEF